MTRSDKRLVIASVLVGAPALAFWSRSRYPDLKSQGRRRVEQVLHEAADGEAHVCHRLASLRC
jgi:hypothetical protein